MLDIQICFWTVLLEQPTRYNDAGCWMLDTGCWMLGAMFCPVLPFVQLYWLVSGHPSHYALGTNWPNN